MLSISSGLKGYPCSHSAFNGAFAAAKCAHVAKSWFITIKQPSYELPCLDT